MRKLDWLDEFDRSINRNLATYHLKVGRGPRTLETKPVVLKEEIESIRLDWYKLKYEYLRLDALLALTEDRLERKDKLYKKYYKAYKKFKVGTQVWFSPIEDELIEVNPIADVEKFINKHSVFIGIL